MARRSGFEKVIRAIARETAKQERFMQAERRQLLAAEARVVRIKRRERAETERARASYDRESERRAKIEYVEFRELEVYEANRMVAAYLDALKCLVASALVVDDSVTFDSLRMNDSAPSFSPQKALTTQITGPDEAWFLNKVPSPPWYLSFLPRVKAEHSELLNIAQQQFKRSEAEHLEKDGERKRLLHQSRQDYEASLSAYLEKKALRNAEVDAFRYSYYEGDAESIVAYCSMVLEKSDYPEGFPQNFSLAYIQESCQLVIEYELPTPDIIPEVAEYRYLKTKDDVTLKSRKPGEVKVLYADVVASLSLRCLSEMFEADQGGFIEACCFNGYINTVDPATGRSIQPHLVSVRATREVFCGIDLSRVDRAVCLKNLGAHVSRAASDAQPIRPIVEFNMVDKRFVDQADLVSQLSSATNLMDLNPFEFEELVANLFGRMGLESKLTRSSRDGGVDCIAYDARPILGGKVVIQAKRYKNTVGVAAVRDLYGTMMNEGANKGILVTTSGYGPDAFEFAKDKPIELIEGGGLLFLLQEIGIDARIVMPAE
jgi:restriction system protein